MTAYIDRNSPTAQLYGLRRSIKKIIKVQLKPEGREQRAEGRRQRADDRGQRTEGRKQRTEGRGQRTDF
jgi:hypothetical protein